MSHDAQQRVDERVIEIMSRLDTAVRRDPPSDQASRRFSRRPGTSRSKPPRRSLFLDSRAELGQDDLAIGREIRAPSGRECGDQAETTAGRRRRGSVAHRGHVLALVTHEDGDRRGRRRESEASVCSPHTGNRETAGARPKRQCAARRLGRRRRVLWWRSRRMRSRSPSAARFQFLEVAQYWARGVTGVGISCNV